MFYKNKVFAIELLYKNNNFARIIFIEKIFCDKIAFTKEMKKNRGSYTPPIFNGFDGKHS